MSGGGGGGYTMSGKTQIYDLDLLHGEVKHTDRY